MLRIQPRLILAIVVTTVLVGALACSSDEDPTVAPVAPVAPVVNALAGALPVAGAPTPPSTPDDQDGSLAEEALRALEAAEERLRAGDWVGFGAGLDSVRVLLGGG